jgi:4-amino-4-deoxy-L-arabinose transferase-like glycosyltransferase
MTEPKTQNEGALPTPVLAAGIALVGAGVMVWLKGMQPMGDTLARGLPEVVAATVIVVAGGGYAWPIIRRVSPQESPIGLRAITAALLGLWLLAIGMLVIGTVFAGSITPWLWWPIVLVGTGLAGWHARERLNALRIPSRVDGRSLVWVVIAAAAAIWLAGATVPPGFIGATDSYDVLEYHLQVPREFCDAQQISPTWHNCYGFYPLGVEMLFLLAMALRGGAYEGMYLAKLMHGMFGVLAVIAVYTSLRREQESRARFAAGLLATVPLLLYLGWLAMSELAIIAHLALALLWLREWSARGQAKAACCIGLAIGGACAAKYLSVGFVALPVLIAMLIGIARPPRRQVGHLGIAAMASLLLFAPWLVRNLAYTGNPVFPLATQSFGRGHWSEESEQRWNDGHAPDKRPPVPSPDGYVLREEPGRAELLVHHFISYQPFGPILLWLAGVAVCVLIASRKPPGSWDWMLVVTALAQLGVWTAFTRGMPSRFLVPILVPICLLAGGLLAKLARVESNPFRRESTRPAHGPWGLAPAIAIFAATALINLLIAVGMFGDPGHGARYAAPEYGRIIALSRTQDLPEGARPMLVGEARAFYFPTGTLYATVFDSHPLASLLREDLSAKEMQTKLREMGATHLWVDWNEIRRLALTYGFPASLTSDLLTRLGGPEVNPVGPVLRLNGVRTGASAYERLELPVVRQLEYQVRDSDVTERRPWPYATIYSVPHPGREPHPTPMEAENGDEEG